MSQAIHQGSLWRRAPGWRACLLMAATLSILAMVFGPQPAPPTQLPEQVSYTPPVPVPGPMPMRTPVPPLSPPSAATISVGSPAMGAAAGPSGINSALLGRTFTGSIPVDGFQLPLPPGEWAMLANGTVRNIEANATGRAYFLGRIEHRRLMGVVDVTTLKSTAQPGTGFTLKNCTIPNPNLNYLSVQALTPQDHQGCWMISHAFTPMMLQWADRTIPMPGLLRAAAGDLTAKGVSVPQDFVTVRFLRAEKWGLLDVSYWFNPETDSITSNRALTYRESDWQPGSIHRFPDKLAYVERIKQWGSVFHERFERAFVAGHTAP